MKQLTVLFLFLTFSLQAQFQINGIVTDASSNVPLAFATISSSLGANTISDVDGKFTLLSNQLLSEISVSYIGYSPKKNKHHPRKKVLFNHARTQIGCFERGNCGSYQPRISSYQKSNCTKKHQ